MAHQRLIWQRCLLVLGLLMLGLGSRCDATVREYAVVSIKIGTASSSSSNTRTLVFELWPDLAPKTVQNFKHLANTRFYDGTASHRLIKDFMIQAGDPNTRSDSNEEFFGQGGPEYTIPGEFASRSDAQSWEKRTHKRGILSMARSTSPSSGGSQFFIMLNENSDLDGNYASFGNLISETDFLDLLNTQPTWSTTRFDSNRDGQFDENEKQKIIKIFNGDESDPSLDPAGFVDINEDGTLTYEELNDPKNKYPHDKPKNRIEIQSVRVFAADAASSTAFPFKATTHSGLLRSPDRSSVTGQYQISVQNTGLMSGVIEYFARRTSFVVQSSLPVIRGTLASSNDTKMAVLQGTIDATAAFPLLLDLTLHQAYSPDSNENAISIELSNKDKVPLAYGFSESLSKAGGRTLARQYTMLAQPSRVVSFIPPVGWQADTTSITGNSVFLIRVNPSLGLSYVSGRMADGAPYTASRTISSEHGANIFPFFSYSLRADIEAQRNVFQNTDLSLWPIYMEGLTTALTSGAVELSDKNSNTAALGKLLWIHPETTSTTAPLKNRSIVSTVTATTPWTPPSRTTVMKPFSSTSPRGQLTINGAPFNFSLVKNTAAAFDQPTSAAKPFLSFDPTTGAFSGVFNDTSTTPARRRSFSGVLLNSTNATGGFGYFLDSNSSKSIRILPVIP